MDRVQFALEKQLKGAFDISKLRLSEQGEELTRQRRSREDIGVQLYQVQQQLAKLQMNLEKVHENHAIIAQMREAAEADLAQVRPAYGEQLGEVKEQRLKYEKFQSELDQLHMTLRQVETYNDQMKSEIAVTRRATYKAEESINTLESGKKQQDILIDSLNEQLRHAQEELALTETQLVAQGGETSVARQTLKDASAEMEAINFEKKQLLQQWKVALIGMQRRDEALQATEEALVKQREQEMALDSEVSGVKKAIKREEEKNEVLTATESKLESESRAADASMLECKEKEERQHEKFAMLNKSLEQTDAELTRVTQQEAALEHEVNALEAQVQKTMMEARKLQDSALTNLGEQVAVEKGAANTSHATEKLRAQREEMDMAAAQMHNELARIRVDTLNTMSHNSQLGGQLKALNEELTEKDTLMAKYEQESRRRNIEIEKKQHELDLLNRKFDSLMKQRAGVAELDEDAGPLEATIVHLKRELSTKEAENAEFQRVWIRAQTDLVNVANGNQTVTDQLHDKRAKTSILMQKQMRLETQFDREAKEVKELERGNAGLHNELTKVNQLLAEHSTRQRLLVDDNFLMETEFVEKLKSMELEAASAEGQIVELKAQKERLLLDVVEAEKQIMLIEKKIALERETQAALDPEVGAAEVQAMQREIHRMRLRYAQLQRRQEQMITEMERAIYKRDNIEAKGKLASQKKGAPPTQAVLLKDVGELQSKLKSATHDASMAQLSVQKLQEKQAQENGYLEEAEAKLLDFRKKSERMGETILTQEQQQLVQRKQLSKHNRLIQKLVAAAEGVYQPAGEERLLSEQVLESRDVSKSLLNLVEALGFNFTRHTPLLSSLIQSVTAKAD